MFFFLIQQRPTPFGSHTVPRELELYTMLYLYFIIRFCRPIRKEEEIENLLPNTNLQFPFVEITHRPEYQIFVSNADGV